MPLISKKYLEQYLVNALIIKYVLPDSDGITVDLSVQADRRAVSWSTQTLSIAIIRDSCHNS